MGRDGTALLPLLCAIVLLRIYPAEAESEIKMISTFSLIITNHLQKHWEKEHVCWVLGFAATGSACTCLEHNTAAAMLRAGWETRTALTCSLGVPTGAMCNSQAKNAICPFPESQVVTEKGKNIVPGREMDSHGFTVLILQKSEPQAVSSSDTKHSSPAPASLLPSATQPCFVRHFHIWKEYSA